MAKLARGAALEEGEAEGIKTPVGLRVKMDSGGSTGPSLCARHEECV